MSEQENSEQVATEEKKAEARFNENGVGELLWYLAIRK